MPLSKRAARLNVGNAIWDTMGNLYDPVTNPDGIYSLGVAENTMMHSEMLEYIHRTINLPAVGLTYGDGGKRLRASMARFLNRHLKPLTPIEPDHIAITNGCGPAIEQSTLMFTDPGESVLLGRPFYTGFIDDITTRTGSLLADVAFGDVDPFAPECVSKYEERLQQVKKEGGRVGSLILCNPHNPLGRCYPKETIIELMKFCQKHQIHLISDEIYALSLFENTVDTNPPPVPFESIFTIDPTGIIDKCLIHVVWGMSKDFGANGIRLGALISQANPDIGQVFKNVGYFSASSSLTDNITANVLDDDEWTDKYIATNQRKLREGFELVTSWANKHGIPYAPGANAAFFLWLDFGVVYRKHHPEVAADRNLDQIIYDALIQNKVFLGAGFRFGAEKPGWFRIVFTQDKAYVEEALARTIKTLEGGGIGGLSLEDRN